MRISIKEEKIYVEDDDNMKYYTVEGFLTDYLSGNNYNILELTIEDIDKYHGIPDASDIYDLMNMLFKSKLFEKCSKLRSENVDINFSNFDDVSIFKNITCIDTQTDVIFNELKNNIIELICHKYNDTILYNVDLEYLDLVKITIGDIRSLSELPKLNELYVGCEEITENTSSDTIDELFGMCRSLTKLVINEREYDMARMKEKYQTGKYTKRAERHT